MLMNAIYLNVQREAEKGVEKILVCFSGNRGGHAVDYVFNPNTKTYREGQSYRY